jgi:nitroreductase
MNPVVETIKNRRSIRRFQSEQIDRKALDIILESAIWAPSGHNTQPWHFLVIQDPDKIDRMSSRCIEKMADSPIDWIRKIAAREGYHLFHKAPTVVVVSSKKSDERDGLFYLADCSAAIQNMLLAAESLDIGTCWIGLTKFLFEDFGEVDSLNLPEGYLPFYTVAMGYKAADFVAVPPPRKPGTVSWFGE